MYWTSAIHRLGYPGPRMGSACVRGLLGPNISSTVTSIDEVRLKPSDKGARTNCADTVEPENTTVNNKTHSIKPDNVTRRWYRLGSDEVFMGSPQTDKTRHTNRQYSAHRPRLPLGIKKFRVRLRNQSAFDSQNTGRNTGKTRPRLEPASIAALGWLWATGFRLPHRWLFQRRIQQKSLTNRSTSDISPAKLAALAFHEFCVG